MTAQLSPTPVQKFFDNNGFPLFRGTLTTYQAGTTTPQATYVDSTQTTQNTNPITLNYRGECNLWLDPTLTYKFVLKDFFGNLIWTVDNIQGGFTPSAIAASLIPKPTNTWTLGDSTHSWAQLYLGGNASPVLDIVSGIIGYYPRTPAEIAAGVTPTSYAYAPLNLLRYGADPTGVAASDSAMTRALAVCAVSAQNGGRIYLPANPPSGFYLFANPIILNQASGITIYGDGACTAGAGPATVVKYSGTGSTHFIQLTSALGCKIQGMQIVNTSGSFTGAMVRCGNDGVMGHLDSTFCAVQDVTFNATSSCYHLDLNKCIEFQAERCNFAGGAASVKGQQSGGYANDISFYDCQWLGCASTPVLNGGQTWAFYSCTFEALSNGQAGGFAYNGFDTLGITFRDCWFGDVSVAGGIWLNLAADGLVLSGNLFSGETGNTYAVQLNNCLGFEIKGNCFTQLTTAINFGTPTSNGGDITGNYFDPSVTNIYGTLANAGNKINFNPNNTLVGANTSSQSTSGWELSPNGVIRQWGTIAVTISAGLGAATLTYPEAFPNACWSCVLTPSSTASHDVVWWTNSRGRTTVAIGAASATNQTATFDFQATGN